MDNFDVRDVYEEQFEDRLRTLVREMADAGIATFFVSCAYATENGDNVGFAAMGGGRNHWSPELFRLFNVIMRHEEIGSAVMRITEELISHISSDSLDAKDLKIHVGDSIEISATDGEIADAFDIPEGKISHDVDMDELMDNIEEMLDE